MSDLQKRHDPVEALLRSAGTPVEPDAGRMERAMRNVHAEWQSALASRRRARWQRLAAIAAAIVLAIAAFLQFRPRPPVPVATITRVIGESVVRRVEGGKVQVEPSREGRVLLSGDEVDTSASGRILLSTGSGAQVRVDTQSISQWKSPSELRLTSGAVYVDTAMSAASAPPLTVSSPLGDVRHVGTRFEVRVASDELQVRVREGRVSFSREGSAPLMLNGGQQLVATRTTSIVQNGPGASSPEWDWTRQIAPAFAIEGHSVFEALEWLGEESGLRVVYTSEQARSQARATILRGTVDGLETRAALRAVLAGSDLAFELRPDRIEVRPVESR